MSCHAQDGEPLAGSVAAVVAAVRKVSAGAAWMLLREPVGRPRVPICGGPHIIASHEIGIEDGVVRMYRFSKTYRFCSCWAGASDRHATRLPDARACSNRLR